MAGLDLDDVRTVVAESAGHVGTGEHPGEVEDAYSGEGSRRFGVTSRGGFGLTGPDRLA